MYMNMKYIYIYIYIYIHIYIYIYIYIYITLHHITSHYIPLHNYIHILYIHTYIHTYIHCTIYIETRYRSPRYVEDNPATSHREDVARSEAIPSNGKRVLSGSGQYEAPGLEPSRVASIKLFIHKYMLHLYTNKLNIYIYIYMCTYHINAWI